MLGFIMSIGYSMASRSLRTVRQSQERVEALKLAEGQLEQLKALQQKNPPDSLDSVADYDRPFCFNNNGVASQPFLATVTIPDNSNLATDTLLYNPSTSHPSVAGCVNQGPGGLYNISIVGPNQPTTEDEDGTYIVRVRWLRYGGGGNDEVKLEYRLYKDSL